MADLLTRVARRYAAGGGPATLAAAVDDGASAGFSRRFWRRWERWGSWLESRQRQPSGPGGFERAATRDVRGPVCVGESAAGAGRVEPTALHRPDVESSSTSVPAVASAAVDREWPADVAEALAARTPSIDSAVASGTPSPRAGPQVEPDRFGGGRHGSSAEPGALSPAARRLAPGPKVDATVREALADWRARGF